MQMFLANIKIYASLITKIGLDLIKKTGGRKRRNKLRWAS